MWAARRARCTPAACSVEGDRGYARRQGASSIRGHFEKARMRAINAFFFIFRPLGSLGALTGARVAGRAGRAEGPQHPRSAIRFRICDELSAPADAARGEADRQRAVQRVTTRRAARHDTPARGAPLPVPAIRLTIRVFYRFYATLYGLGFFVSSLIFHVASPTPRLSCCQLNAKAGVWGWKSRVANPSRSARPAPREDCSHFLRRTPSRGSMRFLIKQVWSFR